MHKSNSPEQSAQQFAIHDQHIQELVPVVLAHYNNFLSYFTKHMFARSLHSYDTMQLHVSAYAEHQKYPLDLNRGTIIGDMHAKMQPTRVTLEDSLIILSKDKDKWKTGSQSATPISSPRPESSDSSIPFASATPEVSESAEPSDIKSEVDKEKIETKTDNDGGKQEKQPSSVSENDGKIKDEEGEEEKGGEEEEKGGEKEEEEKEEKEEKEKDGEVEKRDKIEADNVD